MNKNQYNCICCFNKIAYAKIEQYIIHKTKCGHANTCFTLWDFCLELEKIANNLINYDFDRHSYYYKKKQ